MNTIPSGFAPLRSGRRLRAVVPLLALALAACAAEDGATGPDRSGPSREIDSGGGRDAGGGLPDTTGANDTDAAGGTDAADPDAGARDAGSDLTADAVDDAFVDAAVDVGVDDTADDTAPPDAGTVDVREDVPSECDRDGDGARAESCGGDDCDDDNPRVNPSAREACDLVDNDCSGTVNDGLTCTIYAHSSSRLYEIDPFLRTTRDLGTVPGLFDLDTAPDGTLYGISGGSLARFDAARGSWSTVGSLGISGGSPNGLAIDSRGTAYATSGNTLYTVDLTSGAATRVGAMGGSFNSSGDCVVNKSDTLYMTSNHAGGRGDALVLIDGRTGTTTEIGRTGYNSIYGLTAAWGYLFGFTSAGDVISIDEATGAAELVHRFSGIIFYGAASSTTR